MSEQTKTCNDPCTESLAIRMQDLKEGFSTFINDYKTAHQDLVITNQDAHKEIIAQVKATNGSVAKVKVWQERANGVLMLATAIGLIGWLGKYAIAFLEK